MSSSDATTLTYDVNQLDICEQQGELQWHGCRSASLAVWWCGTAGCADGRRLAHPHPYAPCALVPPHDAHADDFFKYWPSLALACTALALFTLAALVVGILTERRKPYRFVHCIT